MDEDTIETIPDVGGADPGIIPFYGVLCPEGVPTADGRKFAPESMRWRDLPLPLLWQKTTADGHDGSVIVGLIESIERKDGVLWATGRMTVTAESDEVIGLMAESALRGVSVDVYDAKVETQSVDGAKIASQEDLEALGEDVDVLQVLIDGEIAGATLCAFPAFRQAFISLGHKPEDEGSELERVMLARSGEEFVSEKSWDGSPSRFTVEQYHRSCIIHAHSGDPESKSECKMPIREPDGELSRAGVHAAAARLNQVDAPDSEKSKARAALRSAYKELGEEAPDVISAAAEEGEDFDAEEFAPGRTEDGPGWLTHPVDTNRLRNYWVRGAGAAKIGWGTPGDFNRCRALLAQYVKPQHLSGYCANRHFDALGIWPGRHSAGDAIVASGETKPWSLVAAAIKEKPEMEWFTDPGLVEPSPLVVTEGGRVFGHLATWDVCHIGQSGTCVTAPRSASNYAYFLTGLVETASGPVRVGQVTIDTGHADLSRNATAALAHYDNTGAAVADVAVGEDAHGIWVAGRIREYAADEQVESLRAAALSGDWRWIGGELELVAALAVNVPGFPIPRPALAASGGSQTSLIAASMVAPSAEFSVEQVEQIARRVLAEDREQRAARAALREIETARARVDMAAIARQRSN